MDKVEQLLALASVLVELQLVWPLTADGQELERALVN